MNPVKRTLKLTFASLMFSAALTGCAKESGPAAPPVVTPVGGACTSRCGEPTIPDAPPGTGEDPSKTGYDSGSTATLELVSKSALSRMFYNSVPNNPTNVRINIDLERKSESVIISYVDNGKIVEAAMGVIHPWSGHTDERFNKWYSQQDFSGNMIPVYKGFFQDEYGAIILLVDKAISQGDGRPADFVGGEVWFQNFTRNYPNNPQQGPLKMCWEITLGPYDCRSFLVGNGVNMTSSFYPNNRGPDRTVSYEKLGTFRSIKREQARFPEP